MSAIPDKLFYSIGEAAAIAGVKPHVLRYWENEFSSLQPQKNESGQRVYRRKDIETILHIKNLLYKEGYTIAGARKIIKYGQQPPESEHEVLRTMKRDLEFVLTLLEE